MEEEGMTCEPFTDFSLIKNSSQKISTTVVYRTTCSISSHFQERLP